MTKFDGATQESHLIRHGADQVLPNNLMAQGNNNNIECYGGLGWFISSNFGREVIWHNGATIGGYNAYMAFNPTAEGYSYTVQYRYC